MTTPSSKPTSVPEEAKKPNKWSLALELARKLPKERLKTAQVINDNKPANPKNNYIPRVKAPENVVPELKGKWALDAVMQEDAEFRANTSLLYTSILLLNDFYRPSEESLLKEMGLQQDDLIDQFETYLQAIFSLLNDKEIPLDDIQIKGRDLTLTAKQMLEGYILSPEDTKDDIRKKADILKQSVQRLIEFKELFSNQQNQISTALLDAIEEVAGIMKDHPSIDLPELLKKNPRCAIIKKVALRAPKFLKSTSAEHLLEEIRNKKTVTTPSAGPVSIAVTPAPVPAPVVSTPAPVAPAVPAPKMMDVEVLKANPDISEAVELFDYIQHVFSLSHEDVKNVFGQNEAEIEAVINARFAGLGSAIIKGLNNSKDITGIIIEHFKLPDDKAICVQAVNEVFAFLKIQYPTL